MNWTILILTQPSREKFLTRLMNVLEPQLSIHRDVSVARHLFDDKLSLGENRQRMIDNVHFGDYVSFIDDDDLVAPDYVETIYPLLDGVDYVGFRVQCWIDGQPLLPTYHSLRYPRWCEDAHGFYRDISHLNPIRRDLALLAKMEGGHGEDRRWAAALRATGKVRTENCVPREKIMYHYLVRTVKDDRVMPRLPEQMKQFFMKTKGAAA